MTSHLFLTITTTLVTLSLRPVTSRIPPATEPSPAMAPGDRDAVDKMAREMGLTPEQHRQVTGAVARLESRSSPWPSPAGLALTPEQERHVAGTVVGMGSGSPLSPAVQEMMRSELSPERAERIKEALSPESTRKGKDMARDMIDRSGMSPEQRQKAMGDAEKALAWGNSQLKNIIGADSKEAAPIKE